MRKGVRIRIGFGKILYLIVSSILSMIGLFCIAYYFIEYKDNIQILINQYENKSDLEGVSNILKANREKITTNFSKEIIIEGNNSNTTIIDGYQRFIAEIPFSAWNGGNAIKISFNNANVGTSIYYYNPNLNNRFTYQPYGGLGLNPDVLLTVPQKTDSCIYLTYQIGLEHKIQELDPNCNIVPVANTSIYPYLILVWTFWNRDINTSMRTKMNIEFLNINLTKDEMIRWYGITIA